MPESESDMPGLNGTWQKYDAEDGHGCIQRMTCIKHPGPPFCSCVGVDMPHRGISLGMIYTTCAWCWYEAERNPLQSDVGLEEVPDYWRLASGHHIDRVPRLHCKFHNRYFLTDEACRRCVDEDDQE